MKQIIYVVFAFGVLMSCTERREYREALSRAEEKMNNHPDSALMILDSLGRHEQKFGRHFRMQYLLHRMNAENKASKKFISDSLAKELVEHFESHGTSNERMLAHYLLGRALYDMNEAPAALQAYYNAITVADTLNGDCNFITLKGIYGQMAYIFHQQNLPHDEIWAVLHYIDCIRRTANIEEFIVARGQLIKPYYLLGEKDTVLQIINDTYNSLKRLGKEQRAASILPTAIYIYVERYELSKAKQIMDIFEHESGLFDENGNIAKGREHYYITKGFYELATNKIDSAELYFRKAIQNGKKEDAYKGLLEVYRHKGDLDSIVFFSKLNENALDTLHKEMQIDAIHQMSMLYNYNRSQKEAEQEREKAREARAMNWMIAAIAFLLMGGIAFFFWIKQKKKKEKIRNLEKNLEKAKSDRKEVQEELEKLKSNDYESVIAAKEKKEAELTLTIERLEAEHNKENMNDTDNLDAFLESKIAQLFIKKANGKAERPVPSDAEWKLLESQFRKDMPAIFKSFGRTDALSPMEQNVCILLLLKIPTNAMIIMLNSSAQSVSRAKSRANLKLFNKEGSKSLENNLFSVLRRP
ncbi:MAG: hypothetical protein J6X07_07750 [Prevotella sp.]|nr:hypothetical protein [Prevotella sp.]